MKKILLIALAFIMVVSTSALCESEQLHYLWDIPITTSAETYADEMYTKKHIEFYIGRYQDGGYYKTEAVASDYVDINGCLAKIWLYQDSISADNLTPLSSFVRLDFGRVYSADYTNALIDAGQLANKVFSGLIGKYGQPTSMRVKFDNSYFIKYGQTDKADVEVETVELTNEFYNDNFIYLHDIAESWKCPAEFSKYDIQAIFSNVELLFSYDGSGYTCTVTYHDKPAEPMKVGYTVTPSTEPPEYEDSGF